jgi:uncharacterized small protein (DUF1192 family)
MSLPPNLEKFLNEGMSKTFGYEKEKENYRKTMIPFKSPDVDALTTVEIHAPPNGYFEPRSSQYAYTQAVVYGDTKYLDGELNKLKALLPYAEQAYKTVENSQDDFGKKQKMRIQLVVDELKNVISFLEAELTKLKANTSKGGKKKSRKSKTKKVRKTRRVKKLNGGN